MCMSSEAALGTLEGWTGGVGRTIIGWDMKLILGLIFIGILCVVGLRLLEIPTQTPAVDDAVELLLESVGLR